MTRTTPFKGGGEYWVEIAAREIESLGMRVELLFYKIIDRPIAKKNYADFIYFPESNGAHSSIVEICGYSNQNWHVTGSCIGPSRVHNSNNLIYLSQ